MALRPAPDRDNRLALVLSTTSPMTLMFLRGQVLHLTRAGMRTILLSSPGDGLDAAAQAGGAERAAIRMRRRPAPVADIKGEFNRSMQRRLGF